MKPLLGLRITLISDSSHAPYSGMLPGLIAGHYSFDEAHIDLRRLCQWANARFISDSVTAINPKTQKLSLSSQSDIDFDILSINIGSTPTRSHIVGAEKFAIQVKPVSKFLGYLKENQTSLKSRTGSKISIIGGGTGGVELAFALKHLSQGNAKISIFQSAPEIIPEQSPSVRSLVNRVLKRKGINITPNSKVIQVDASQIEVEGGQVFESDHNILVTQAAPAPFLRTSGLTNHRGFIEINSFLQSRKFPFIFAAGDVAELSGSKQEKSGVYAVRQAKTLARNIRSFLRQKPLSPFVPQKDFLRLIGTADGKAIASKSQFGCRSSLLWQLKQIIDKRFMAKFSKLRFPKQRVAFSLANSQLERASRTLSTKVKFWCTGCGEKVGARVLHEGLSGLNESQMQFDDASVVSIENDKILLQSIDHISAFISDEYSFGKIAVNHAFSDIFAMGAEAHSALVSLHVPYSSENVSKRIIERTMQAISTGLDGFGATLLGGHTTRAEKLAAGIVANGRSQLPLLTKAGARANDHLVLTRPLGSGILIAAQMQGKAKGYDLDDMLAEMMKSNYEAVDIIQKYQVSACSDVTGFGLIGHLIEIISSSKVNAKLKLESLPILNGVFNLIEQKIESSIAVENRWCESLISGDSKDSDNLLYQLLFDPQTAGGLIVTISPEKSADLCRELRDVGYSEAKVIGEITELTEEVGARIFV